MLLENHPKARQRMYHDEVLAKCTPSLRASPKSNHTAPYGLQATATRSSKVVSTKGRATHSRRCCATEAGMGGRAARNIIIVNCVKTYLSKYTSQGRARRSKAHNDASQRTPPHEARLRNCKKCSLFKPTPLVRLPKNTEQRNFFSIINIYLAITIAAFFKNCGNTQLAVDSLFRRWIFVQLFREADDAYLVELEKERNQRRRTAGGPMMPGWATAVAKAEQDRIVNTIRLGSEPPNIDDPPHPQECEKPRPRQHSECRPSISSCDREEESPSSHRSNISGIDHSTNPSWIEGYDGFQNFLEGPSARMIFDRISERSWESGSMSRSSGSSVSDMKALMVVLSGDAEKN
ncbi:hypothetical protein BDN70DRAFT_981795 [Pholiota conissans]|uniref:Uncharacterized protein n=1 Tax=Pholiota conissans TaxID=109636 RepID=A0A9P5YKD7_9AGAR|nr:hypothetical protein BDN70DRAFT_981795 [Pholiota conissans]